MLKTTAVLLAALCLVQGTYITYSYPPDNTNCDGSPVTAIVNPLNICFSIGDASARATVSADKKAVIVQAYTTGNCSGTVLMSFNATIGCADQVKTTLESSPIPAPGDNDSAIIGYLGGSCSGTPTATTIIYGRNTTAACSTQTVGGVRLSEQTVPAKDAEYPVDGAGAIATFSFALIALIALLL